MRYIFGPVNSRRFGRSIGIDLSPDEKSCNFDCLYCELKRANTVSNIKNPPDPDDVLEELKYFLDNLGYPDVITITANGEPTLYPYLDKLIKKVNQIKGESKTLILSNGSTINKKDLQQTLKELDIVKISLDAADQKTFEKVNKVHRGINVYNIIKGLIEFRNIFKGELVIEVLLVRNVNDSMDNIIRLSQVLKKINPDRVDLGTVDRPPAYAVNPLTDEELLLVADHFNDLNVNVITRGKDRITKKINLSEEQIIKTLSRRPYTYNDINAVFTKETVEKINCMVKKGKLKQIKSGNHIFVCP